MYKVIKKAEDLPEEWNKLCDKNIYMQKDFLIYMEKANNCGQSYHLFYKDDVLYSCFMMFEKKSDLFMFANDLDIKVKMKFIYLPLSVTEPGFVFGEDKSEVENVLNSMNGYKIIMNTKENESLKNFHKGDYLPICILENKWKTFDDYLNSLRANYRRRYNQALRKGKNLKIEILQNNNDFNEEMYQLYEQVYNHSEYYLEKLSLEFFKNDISKIITFTANNKVCAILQLIEDRKNDTLIFEFVGYDYNVAHEYDLYHNILLTIVKYGIENGFKYTNLGQTAYDAKLKLGAKMNYNYLLFSHSNKFINWLIKKSIHYLDYNVEEFSFNVFKEESK